MPTLPPTLESCANIVVGTWINPTPLNNVAAINPAKSPVAPPPNAMIHVLRELFA